MMMDRPNNTKNIEQTLAEIAGNDPQFIKNLMANGETIEVESGQIVMKEGAYVKTIPILLSGLVKVYRQEADKEILLYYIYPGESCIMTISAGTSSEPNQVSGVVEEDAEILLIPITLFNELYQHSTTLQQFTLKLYRAKFEELLEAFNAVVFKKIDDRIASYLTEKMKIAGSDVLNLTHQEIAEDLGLARETVSRMLKKLEHEGVIQLGRGRISLSK